MLLGTMFYTGLGLLSFLVLHASGSPMELGTPYCGMVQDTDGVGYGLYATSEGAPSEGVASRLGQCQSLPLGGSQINTYTTKASCSCYFFNDKNCNRWYFTQFSGGATVVDTDPKHQPQAYKCCLSIKGMQGSCTHW